MSPAPTIARPTEGVASRRGHNTGSAGGVGKQRMFAADETVRVGQALGRGILYAVHDQDAVKLEIGRPVIRALPWPVPPFAHGQAAR